MVFIKYSLYDNAISSFFISKDAFVQFYYKNDSLTTEKMINEQIKIALVFLENSIELMLKAILSADNYKIIFKCPNKIENAKKKVTHQKKLEDVLLEDGDFKTITYTEAVKLYIDTCKNHKVEKILTELGKKRNAVTHFGIDESNNISELYACFINTYDVIYNYLYPRLIELDDVGHFFVDDDIVNISPYDTLNFLFDKDFIYTNVIDFLDELLESAPSYIFELRKSNDKFNLSFFLDILINIKNDRKFISSLDEIGFEIEFDDFFDDSFPACRFINFCFDKNCCDGKFYLIWSYSIYFNYSFFEEESLGMIFIIDHSNNLIYYYNGSIDYHHDYDEAELEFDFNSDILNSKCTKFNLSKRNLEKILLEQAIKLKEEI